MACINNCSVCSDGTTCTTCASITRELPNCTCKSSYTESGTTDCTPICPHYCTGACDLSLTCLSCPDFSTNNRQNDLPNNCPCLSGYYDDGTVLCKACISNCSVCSDGTTCTTCASITRQPPTCTCKSSYTESGTTDCTPSKIK